MTLQPAGSALEVTGLTKRFYGVAALDAVDFLVRPGELVGLIGPNGSGKTTAIDCISGLQRADAGSVRVDGDDVVRSSPHALARRGVARTFQNVRVFGTVSVRRNLMVAALASGGHRLQRLTGFLAPVERWPGIEERIEEVLEMFGLRRVGDLPAGQLSYGQRKLVEFAASMMVKPRLLLLDEPVAAVNPTIANVIRDWIKSVHASGVTVLLVEHNIELVMQICQRLVVLDHGVKIADGEPAAVVNHAHVQEAYLGR
jgi:branched-chain amino acid transport system ATP-binding protein